MDIATTLKLCHEIVWKYRAELEPYWPTPTTEDALLFAFTELGEAVDAHLRSKPEYARNRDKDLSVLDELADCALMLLTAMGIRFQQLGEYGEGGVSGLTAIGFDVSMAMRYFELTGANHCGWSIYCYAGLSGIATHPGMDLPARLTSRLERIKAKRLPPPKVSVSDAYAELERHWPSLEEVEDGVDIFAGVYPVSGEPVQGD